MYGVDIVGPSVWGFGRNGLACRGKTTSCKKSVGGTQVICVGAIGVYENGTYMYNGILVYLYVVAVSTSRLVLTPCALSCGFPSMCAVLNVITGWWSGRVLLSCCTMALC